MFYCMWSSLSLLVKKTATDIATYIYTTQDLPNCKLSVEEPQPENVVEKNVSEWINVLQPDNSFQVIQTPKSCAN